MSLLTLAIVNGLLVAVLLAGLAYVCAIPFRIDRPGPASRPQVRPNVAVLGDSAPDRYAA
jgi:hypothetical protein